MNIYLRISHFVLLILAVVSIESCTRDIALELNTSTNTDTDNNSSDDQDTDEASDPNLWVSAYMEKYYLWNDEYATIKSGLNFSAEPETFFYSALSSMQTNTEDGKTYNGTRYYYSTLTATLDTSSKALTTANDYGIDMLYYTYSPDETALYFIVASVANDSPADLAGIKRGQFISMCNGSEMKDDATIGYYYNMLMGYTDSSETVTLTMGEYQSVNNGGYTLGNVEDIVLAPAAYERNPIVHTQSYKSPDNTKNVAYMVYSEFDSNADDKLIEAFENFKNEGVNEMIIDLRYNGGGDIYSSALIASAVAGSKLEGGVYCEMQFNESRTESGDEGFFYIGTHPSISKYQYIVDALSVSLDLDRLYVIATNFTASASELIINGLRGLDFDVFVVGDTTEGKNVGMEVVLSSYSSYSSYDFGDYEYELAPITFYALNAEGSCDYSSGIGPDFPCSESAILADWGDNSGDPHLYATLYHIYNGAWPTDRTSKSTADCPQIITNKSIQPHSAGLKVARY
ncbi:MAG: S41 family peptidase [Rikenellaceae bacterium]